jgi:hypothetical protein
MEHPNRIIGMEDSQRVSPAVANTSTAARLVSLRARALRAKQLSALPF